MAQYSNDLGHEPFGSCQENLFTSRRAWPARGKKHPHDAGASVRPDHADLADHLEFYPLDGDKFPELWEGRDNDLPTKVLATTNEQYMDTNDPLRILRFYDGDNLPASLSKEERAIRLEHQRKRLVLKTECREDGCHEEIKVTVAMAARAIREHHLIEKNEVYEPPTLCKKHRFDRDVRLAEKRRDRDDRLSAPIGEHVSARDAAAAGKPDKKKDKDKDKNRGGRGRSRRDKAAEPVNPEPEASCADQDAVAVAPLTEPELTPQASAPEPEPEQQPAA
jgi:hypothetical protein